MRPAAVWCAHPGCHRSTRDFSGRCHDHRNVTAENSVQRTPPKPRPTPAPGTGERVEVKKRALGHTHEDFYDVRGYFYRRVLRSPDGSIKSDTYYRPGPNGPISREDGGPAMIDYRPDGTVSIEQWEINGKSHRVDGPAVVEYREDGSIEQSFYRLNDQALMGRPALVRRLREMTAKKLRSEFERSSFRVLLDEGVQPEKILGVFAAGVGSTEGIREVLAGAPVEWVLAYEEGRPVTPAPTS